MSNEEPGKRGGDKFKIDPEREARLSAKMRPVRKADASPDQIFIDRQHMIREGTAKVR